MTTKKREELELKDIFFNKDNCSIATYAEYELLYKKDTNCLYRFPELKELFENHYYIEYSKNWSFFRIKKHSHRYTVENYDPLYDTKFVANIAYNAFSNCEKLAVKIDHNDLIYVYDRPYYIDESFEVFRNKCLNNLREYLSISHIKKSEDDVIVKENTQIIKYSEKFYSMQGEGLYTGKPTIWLRLFSCNLNCDGFGQEFPTNPETYILPYKEVDVNRITMIEELPVFKYGCDSSYSWSAKFKHLQHTDTADNVAHSLHKLIPSLHYSMNNLPREKHPIHLCFTGGEPLVKPNQKQVCAILNSYMKLYDKKMPYNITFETNGTQKITNELAAILLNKELPFKVLLSYSPKLFHVSGEPAKRALTPDVIKYNYDLLHSDFTLKFVLNDVKEAWDEMEEYLDELNYLIPGVRRFVYIMPVGADKDSQDDIAGKIADMALSKGYAVSARVHAYLWNNPIGK